MEIEQREFRADPLKMKRLRVAAGLTVKDFKEQSGLDKATVGKILRGDPVFLKSLTTAAEKVFNIQNPLELLHPDELEAMGAQTEVPSPGQIMEWEIDKHLSGWKQTTNGLQYQLVRLHHRYLDHRLARGKCYELRHLTGSESQRVEKYLLRHVEVCEQIGDHPHVAHNITAAPVGGLWWVLDRWEDGITLADRLDDGALGQYALRTVMTGIAKGLAALHKSQIVRRELSPQSVLLREQDDRAILTDMELAKLAEGEPTVSPTQWPDDPYRALEVSGDTPIDQRADIYSWARIFTHCATGEIYERGQEPVESIDVPSALRELIEKSLSLTPSSRPNDLKKILKALKAWP